MTKSKTFWAAAAFISLAAMALAGYSVYELVSQQFMGDKIEVHPVPMPVSEAEAGEDAAQAEQAAPKAETAKTAPKPEAAKAAAQAEPEKIKAVKTPFEYKDAKARSVQIAGSFSAWKNVKMTKKNGVWKTEIYILPGTYPYHFTVDGKKKLAPGKPAAPTGDSLVTVD